MHLPPPPPPPGISPTHGLFATAGEDGVLECFDLRQRTSVGRVDAAQACGHSGGWCSGAGVWPLWWVVVWCRRVATLVGGGVVQACSHSGGWWYGAGVWPLWWQWQGCDVVQVCGGSGRCVVWCGAG